MSALSTDHRNGPLVSAHEVSERYRVGPGCYNDTAMRRLAPVAIGMCLLLCALAVAESKGPLADLTFTVLKEDGGKPVRNAAVVLHPLDKNGRQAKDGLELKTDQDGKASIDAMPYGTMRLQVLMTGFQTYGEDIVINQPKQEFTVKLKHPQQQYSIYDK